MAQNMADEFIIVGDTEKYSECLVRLCGTDEDRAKEILHRMLTNATEDDQHLMSGHTNLRIKKVKSRDCWWNDPFLCN